MVRCKMECVMVMNISLPLNKDILCGQMMNDNVMCEVIFQNHNFSNSMNYMIKDYKTTYPHLPEKMDK